MTINGVIGSLRSVGFQLVPSDGHQSHDFQLGKNDDYRMWHPLLNKPGAKKAGSAYVGAFDGLPYVSATGTVASCFAETLGVAPTEGPHKNRWSGAELDMLLDAMARLRE